MFYYESQYYGICPIGDSFAHHGIKGQKWGVRRFQNPDGTLTPAGIKRYGTVENFEKSRAEKRERAAATRKKAASVAKSAAKVIGKGVANAAKTTASTAKNAAMTAAEVRGAERGAYDKARYGKKTGNPQEKIDKAKKVAKIAAVAGGAALTAYGIHKLKQSGALDKSVSDEVFRERMTKDVKLFSPETFKPETFKFSTFDPETFKPSMLEYTGFKSNQAERSKRLKKRTSGMNLSNMTMSDLGKLDLW